MGYVPLSKDILSISGEKWELEFYTYLDEIGQKDGTMQFGAKLVGEASYSHSAVLPISCDEIFMDRFKDAFVQSKEFRARCKDLEDGQNIIDRETQDGRNKPKLPKTENRTISRDVSRIASLGRRAKFSDYVKLRSGRDIFSLAGEAKLLEHLDLCATGFEKMLGSDGANLGIDQRLKVLRWMARGLNAEMALKKVKVDLEIAGRRRESRQK